MLIWINGAFGAGKTQTAHELHRRLGAGHVADPELLGFAIHKMLPPGARDDFQNRPQWRSGVVSTLQQAVAATDGPVIVPMTLVRDDYFDEIIGGLRSADIDVRHYALTTTPETLRKRLRTRVTYIGSLLGRDESWAMQQIDRCTTALARDQYATRVSNDNRSVDQVVEVIADDLGLSLANPRLSSTRYQFRRIAVAARHIRL